MICLQAHEGSSRHWAEKLSTSPSIIKVSVQIHSSTDWQDHAKSKLVGPVLPPESVGGKGVLIAIRIHDWHHINIIEVQDVPVLVIIVSQLSNDVSGSGWRYPFPGMDSCK